ncbi:hypothetical protein ACFOOK_28395 [Micromonospora krabiensis]|uniref:Peptidase inhibitor family I36 n=1 Tax=Micromonospora krabiensis TaxID=307121 RepID=A0A1C3N4L9_9ACTN|nr:hypothetical protein [Micromonospora krabiensis]SBV27513.1 hypothetical protein GA0070620_3032 [Micromonospora krabiensis]
MRPTKSARVALLATLSAAAVAVTATPAVAVDSSSSCTYADGTVCLHASKWFDGATIEYTAPLGTACVNTPIGFLGWVNLTDQTLKVFSGAGCTGVSYLVPPGDLHNVQSPLRSFTVV